MAGRRWWERWLFSVMGPPQLGDVRAPLLGSEDPALHLCPTCGRRWEEHTTVRTERRSYRTCPRARVGGQPPAPW